MISGAREGWGGGGIKKATEREMNGGNKGGRDRERGTFKEQGTEGCGDGGTEQGWREELTDRRRLSVQGFTGCKEKDMRALLSLGLAPQSL